MARSIIGFFALALLCGCSASGGAGEVKLGVDVAPIQGVATETGTTGSADPSLAITRVRILVADAKIGYIGEKATGPSAEAGPYVIDLTADEIANGAHRDFSLGSLPSGTYGGAEIAIEPLPADAKAQGDSFADFVSAGASVLVDGTYQGNAFQFAGHFLAEQGTDGDVTIDANTPVTIAMTVDTSSWFVDASGAAVDPADSAQHDALAVAVCKTLDTQPQSGPGGGGIPPADSSAPPADSSAPPAGSGAPPAGDSHGPHGGKGGGDHGKSGGQGAHCVEQAPAGG